MTHREMIAEDLGDMRGPSIMDFMPIPRTERELRQRIYEIQRRYKIEMEYELAPYIKMLAAIPVLTHHRIAIMELERATRDNPDYLAAVRNWAALQNR